jgi:ABC-type molybdate transport system substrate-binding protein
MKKTTDQLVRIAAAGGGMYIDASSRTTDQLVRIASAASSTGATIHINNSSNKTTDQLVRIAAAGSGCVVFDLNT